MKSIEGTWKVTAVRSPPAWGAWIEIQVTAIAVDGYRVAPRMGGVD